MKQIRPIIFVVAALAAISCACTLTSCTTPPSARVVQVQTLKAVGHSAEAAVSLTANLYAGKQITDAQARAVMNLYDQKFQPAFRIAVAAVNANLDALAPADLQTIALQLTNLVASFAKPR